MFDVSYMLSPTTTTLILYPQVISMAIKTVASPKSCMCSWVDSSGTE